MKQKNLYNPRHKIRNEVEMASERSGRYHIPPHWIRYDATALFNLLVEAKAAATVLQQMPYLRQWIAQAHEEQLHLEAEGTSRIEGAEFTPYEREEALAADPLTHTGLTRSQRQLRCADATYRWLHRQPVDRPVTSAFIREIHRRIVTGCDDDHGEPGALRPAGWNVTFGRPICRGAEGGSECHSAFDGLCAAIASEFRHSDPIIQAVAAHYHIGAIHPFGDGNGRTARALEAFMLRCAGVNELSMVSLSNYYYEYKDEYLWSLHQSHRHGHNITSFLAFALKAIIARCHAVSGEIAHHHRRILFREFAGSMFGQLRSPRRRALGARQRQILETLLDNNAIHLERIQSLYQGLKYPGRAMVRDMLALLQLGAIIWDNSDDKLPFKLNLDWPQQFSEAELIARYENMPTAASTDHPAMAELRRWLGRC